MTITSVRTPATAPSWTEKIIEIDKVAAVGNIRVSSPEARQELEELAASIARQGVLEPVLVRPSATPGVLWDLVAGFRRLEAARLAGLDSVPAREAQLTDGQVEEIRLVENVQRRDLHPLEEAEGLRRLQVDHGYTVEQLVEQTGKSRSTVFARLKLRDLRGAARAAFLEGAFDASVALYVARIPDEDLQAKAAEHVRGTDDRPALSAREAAAYIRMTYMLELAGVPWDLADAELVPEAGSCAACPLRTKNAPRELFGDMRKGADVCTSPSCYRQKRAAHKAARLAAALEAGRSQARVGKRDFRSSHTKPHGRQAYTGDKFVDLAAPARELLGNDTRKTWGAALGRKAVAADVAVAADDNGFVHELVPTARAEAIARERGVLKGSKTIGPPKRKPADGRRAHERLASRARVEEETIDRAIELVRECGPEGLPVGRVLKWLALYLAEHADDKRLAALLEHHGHGLKRPPQGWSFGHRPKLLEALAKAITGLPSLPILLELGLANEDVEWSLFRSGSHPPADVAALLSIFEDNLSAPIPKLREEVEKRVQEDLKATAAAARAAAKKKKATTAKKPPAKKKAAKKARARKP